MWCTEICYLNIDVCGIHGNVRISAESSKNHFNDHQTAETANDERTGKQTLQKDVNTKYGAFTWWRIRGHTISADVSQILMLQPHFCCSIPKKFQLSQILPNNKTRSFVSNKTSVKNKGFCFSLSTIKIYFLRLKLKSNGQYRKWASRTFSAILHIYYPSSSLTPWQQSCS